MILSLAIIYSGDYIHALTIDLFYTCVARSKSCEGWIWSWGL